MTQLIAKHAGSYALLAADTMESAIVEGRMHPLHSDAQKIIQTELGPITGSGRSARQSYLAELVGQGIPFSSRRGSR